MNGISSITRNNIVSKTESATGITSMASLNIESKTELNITSQMDNVEKEAFLFTAKQNAAKMFAKFL